MFEYALCVFFVIETVVDNQILIHLVLAAALGWMVWVVTEQDLEAVASLKQNNIIKLFDGHLD